MTQIAQGSVMGDESLDLRRRPIVAGIVHDDHLAEHRIGHGCVGFLDQAANIALLVEGRNDNGDTDGAAWRPIAWHGFLSRTRVLVEATIVMFKFDVQM